MGFVLAILIVPLVVSMLLIALLSDVILRGPLVAGAAGRQSITIMVTQSRDNYQ